MCAATTFLQSTLGVAKLRPEGRLQPPDQFNPTRQIPCTFFSSATFSDCGQQCNSINCCLWRKLHCIRPSSGQAVANSAFGSKSLANPGLVYMDCIDSHSRVEKGVTFVSCRINRTFCRRLGTAIANSQQRLQHVVDRFSAACDRDRIKISTKNTDVLCPCTNQRQCVLQVSGMHCSRWRNSSAYRWYSRVTEGSEEAYAWITKANAVLLELIVLW